MMQTTKSTSLKIKKLNKRNRLIGYLLILMSMIAVALVIRDFVA